MSQILNKKRKKIMNKFRMMSVLFVLAMLFSSANVSPAGAAAVTLQEGTATWSQTVGNFLVDQAVDGIIQAGTNGWAIHPNQGQDQIAVFETSTDISAGQLDFELHQAHGDSIAVPSSLPASLAI